MDARELFECGLEEKVPRVVVKNSGRQLEYETLQGMTAEELESCQIRIFDVPVTFNENGITWGKENFGREHKFSDERALDILTRVYRLCESRLLYD